MPEITKESDYGRALNTLKNELDAGEDMETCLESSTAEHARSDSMDEPCGEGRGG